MTIPADEDRLHISDAILVDCGAMWSASPKEESIQQRIRELGFDQYKQKRTSCMHKRGIASFRRKRGPETNSFQISSFRFRFVKEVIKIVCVLFFYVASYFKTARFMCHDELNRCIFVFHNYACRSIHR